MRLASSEPTPDHTLVPSLSRCRVCRRDGSLSGILQVNLSQRQHHGYGGDNDDKGNKRQISSTDFFFALLLTRLVQVCHRDLLLPPLR